MLYTIYHVPYNYYTLHTIYYIIYTIYCILYTIYYILYTMTNRLPTPSLLASRALKAACRPSGVYITLSCVQRLYMIRVFCVES